MPAAIRMFVFVVGRHGSAIITPSFGILNFKLNKKTFGLHCLSAHCSFISTICDISGLTDINFAHPLERKDTTLHLHAFHTHDIQIRLFLQTIISWQPSHLSVVISKTPLPTFFLSSHIYGQWHAQPSYSFSPTNTAVSSPNKTSS